MKERIEVLESLVLLYCISSKSVVTLKVDEIGDVPDKSILDDVILLLRQSDYFTNSKRIDIHYLLKQFCDLRMWHHLCSPKYASGSLKANCNSRINFTLMLQMIESLILS